MSPLRIVLFGMLGTLMAAICPGQKVEDFSKYYDARDWQLKSQVKVQEKEGRKQAVLVLTVRNVSERLIGFNERNPMVDFAIHIYGANGDEEVPLTELGKFLAEKEFRKHKARPIEPHQALSYEVSLTDCFQLSPSQRYRLTARRYLSDSPFPRDTEKTIHLTPIRLLHVDAELIVFECP